jgi:RNA polymerase sigma-70 factor, ECF subfamily
MAQPKEREQDLIKAILRGETHRYAHLVECYKDRGLALAQGILGAREEAEEVLQDAFLRAFQGLNDFRGDSRFGTWFYRILYNLCLTKLRRRRRGVVSLDDESHPGDPELADESADVLDQMGEEEMHELVAEEVNRLPERFRVPLMLFFINEQSYEEIESVTGMPLGTVKTNIHRAKARVRSSLMARLGKEMTA